MFFHPAWLAMLSERHEGAAMHKQELVQAVADRSDLAPRQVGAVVETAVRLIAEATADGETLTLTGFGDGRRSLTVLGKPAHRARRRDAAPAVGPETDALARLTAALRPLPAGRVEAVERQLREAAPPSGTPDNAGSATLAELELRNLLRVFAGWRRLEERSLSGSQLQRQTGLTRQRLQQLRAEGKLLGLRVPLRRELYYPVWQFAADGTPLPALPRLVAAADEARLDPTALDALMTSPRAAEGATLAELLRRGAEDEVLALVRVAAAHGA